MASSVAASRAEGILLSGGLDTSILATLAASEARRLKAVNVSVAGASEPDARGSDSDGKNTFVVERRER